MGAIHEKYNLDQWEADCLAIISFHFLIQSSEIYWPFGLLIAEAQWSGFLKGRVSLIFLFFHKSPWA